MSSLSISTPGRKGSNGSAAGEISRITVRQAATIHDVAKKGVFGDMEKMLAANPSLLNEVDQFGQTALHIAAFEGHLSVVEFLVEQGSSLSTQDKNGWTPLHCASSNRHLRVVEYLIVSGTNLNAFNLSGSTALHYLVQLPISDHLLFLLDMMVRRDVAIESANEFGITPLHKACQGQSDGVVLFLLVSGADPNAVASHKECAIHIACRLGKQRLIETLIAHGARTETIGPDGNAEETARRNGHDRIAEYIHNLKTSELPRKKRKKRAEGEKTSSGSGKLRSSTNGRERHGSAASLHKHDAPSPRLVKSPTTPSVHSSSEDLSAGLLKSASHKKTSSSHAELPLDSDDDLAASSLTPKSKTRHTMINAQRPTETLSADSSNTSLSQDLNGTQRSLTSTLEALSGANDSTNPSDTTADRNNQKIDQNGNTGTPNDVIGHFTPINIQLSTSAASYASGGSSSTSTNGGPKSPTHAQHELDDARSVASGEDDDLMLGSGSVRSASLRTRSAKINTLMRIFQAPGTDPAQTLPTPELKRNGTPTSRGSSPVTARTTSAKRGSDASASSHHGSGAAAAVSSNQALTTGGGSTHSSPRVGGTSGSPHFAAPLIAGFTSPRSSSPRSASPRMRSPLSPAKQPLIMSGDADDSGNGTALSYVGAAPTERKTSPVPALKLGPSPNGSPARGARSISPHRVSQTARPYAKPPLSAHPVSSSNPSGVRTSTSTHLLEASSSMPSHPMGLAPPEPEFSSEDDFGSSMSPRSFLSSRSFSTDHLMSDSASDTNSDTRIPSGRRFGEKDPSTPSSPRTLRHSSSKPSLDRSTSDILGKVKVRGADSSSNPGSSPILSNSALRGQPQLRGVHRLSSTEFGPRTVQRVSKTSQKNGTRHSKPFTKFLKDINFDSLIAVQDYPTHFQGVVSVDEAMIIPSPDFVVEYAKAKRGNVSPIATPSSAASASQRYTMFSDDTELTTWHYKSNFFDESLLSRSHWNFVSYVELKFHPSPVPMIFSLVPKGSHGILGLVRTPAGDVTFSLDIGDRKLSSLTAKKLIKLMQEQNEALKNAKIYPVKDGALSDQLLEYEKAEKNAFRSICSHKVGVVYVKDGQITEEEMLGNKSGSAKFEDFLECIGKKIDLLDWNGFEGGLDTRKDRTGKHSVFTSWRDFEIMFHVSTYLPLGSGDEKFVERKKHIANDMTSIIFLDTLTTSFKPPTFSGDFLHTFIVVHPKPDGQYGVSIATKKGTPEFGPPLPPTGIFPLNESLREFIISKIINAERAALLAPMFLTKRKQARQHWLAGMINKFMTSK